VCVCECVEREKSHISIILIKVVGQANVSKLMEWFTMDLTKNDDGVKCRIRRLPSRKIKIFLISIEIFS
jgi:hypothetical protein